MTHLGGMLSSFHTVRRVFGHTKGMEGDEVAVVSGAAISFS